MEIYSDVNIFGNEIQNVVVHPVVNEAAIPTPTEGWIIFDQSTATFKYFDGTVWVEVTAGAIYTSTAPIQISGANVITIDAATSTTPGSLSAADKAKLDAATATATASTLVQRTGTGTFESALPVNPADVANKSYVDSLIIELGAFAGGWDASAGLPTTGTGGAGEIDSGDYWYTTVAGTIAGLAPIITVEVGDILTATSDGAVAVADFIVMQRNMDIDTTIYAQRYEETSTFANGTVKTITHGLGKVPVVEMYRQTDGRKINGRIVENGVNAVDIRLNGIGAGLSVRVVCIG